MTISRKEQTQTLNSKCKNNNNKKTNKTKVKQMRTIFWNVDTQYDFMRNDKEHQGTLYVAGAESIEDNLAMLTQYAKEKGFLTINTGDQHTWDDKEISKTPNYQDKWPMHCERGTKGAEYIPATRPESTYVVDFLDERINLEELKQQLNVTIYKNDTDAFKGNPHTDTIIESLKPATTIVYGVAADVCVDDAVNGLLERGVTTYVVTDAIKNLPKGQCRQPWEETLNKWKEAGAKLVTTHDVTKPGGLGTILDYAAFDLEDHSRFEREQRSYTE